MKKFLKLLRYIKPYLGKTGVSVLFQLSSIIFSLFSFAMVIPFLGILFKTQELVTEKMPFVFKMDVVKNNFYYYLSQIVINYNQATALVFICVMVVVMIFFKNLFQYMSSFVLAPIRTGVVKDIRTELYRKILHLPLSYYSEEKKGDLMSRMSADVQEIEISIMRSIDILFRDPLTIIFYLGSLLFINAKLTLFALILLPLTGLMIARIGKTLRTTSFKGQKRMGSLISIIEETLSGIRIIKAFNAEEKMDIRFTSANNFYTRLMIKMWRRRDLAGPMTEFLATLVMVALMWYGGSLVLTVNATIEPQTFMAYLVIFSQLIPPAKSFTTAFYNVQKGMASADRIDEILDADIKIHEADNPISVNDFKESIELRNVSFRYQSELVLKNINLTIKKGKTIALVGQSGSGKSTLVDLLPRFYDVSEGEILLDGKPIKDYYIKDLRGLMGNVNQDSILFNDSIFNNIAFGVNQAAEEDVIAAAKVANAHEFIEQTPRGYYTNIGDRGNKLSGGQRQRLSIARAILKNPPIMILDEATSALDTESERLVQDAIENLMKNRTSVVIAHRLSTVLYADEICVLHEGEIAERGKHEELLALNGIYAKLYNLQAF